MTSRISISTTVYTKAYLAIAWQRRGELQAYERRGFGQFLYITICAHLEETVVRLVRARLRSVTLLARPEAVPPVRFKHGDEEAQDCDMKPVCESLHQICKSIEADISSAPLSRLIQQYGKVFPTPLPVVVGKDLFQDLDALSSLRNMFAHGREFYLECVGSDDTATLNENPIQKAAQRLSSVGIVKNLDVTARDFDKLQTMFYSDEALLHFYRAAQHIDARLLGTLSSALETGFLPLVRPLPDLHV